jgi:hypothetical protein
MTLSGSVPTLPVLRLRCIEGRGIHDLRNDADCAFSVDNERIFCECVVNRRGIGVVVQVLD